MTQPIFTKEQGEAFIERFNAGESFAAMAAEAGTASLTIRRAMLRAGWQPGTTGRRRNSVSDEFARDVISAYEAGESQQSIGERVGMDQTAVSRLLRRRGVKGRPRNTVGARAKERHPQWKGGRVLLNGYVAVTIPDDDPLAWMRNSGGYVLEHRLVMARHLGRLLGIEETVHHINGEHTDNRLENLQLRTGRHGKHAAFVCVDCGSTNVVPTKLL